MYYYVRIHFSDISITFLETENVFLDIIEETNHSCKIMMSTYLFYVLKKHATFNDVSHEICFRDIWQITPQVSLRHY